MKLKENKKLTVALVYDRVNTQYGGAEIVLTALQELFPHAPLYTSVYHKKKAEWAKKSTIIPSFLQDIPFCNDKHQYLLPLMPLAFESFNLSKYDLIISVTSAEAKGILTKPNQKHICYMLTPTRYLYSHKKEYLNSKWYLQLPGIKQIVSILFDHITNWDQSASMRPDVLIPISKLVANRIKTYYHRTPAKVIYPPVAIPLSEIEIEKIPQFTQTHRFCLSVSRLVDYKRVDLSILSCLQLKKPLVVVGTGESEQKLHTLAGADSLIKEVNETIEDFLQRGTRENKTILFTGSLAQKDVYKLYKNCESVLMPGQEDFGITALEAGIFGKPVILFYTSGVAELLKDSVDAIHIKKETVAEMVYALGKLDSFGFTASHIKETVTSHSTQQFKKEFKQQIEKELKGNYVIS